MITLYGGGSPNALKIILMLEELALPYDLIDIKVFEAAQYAPEYLKLNPIAKYPVIVDSAGPVPGRPIFESGAILQYLAETYRPELLPASGPARWETLKWLTAQVAWVGPMFGQHVHFRVHPSEEGGYAATRYRNQVRRICEVLNGELAQRPWLAGGSYSVADIATFPWIAMVPRVGLDWADYPALHAWHDRIAARPAAVRAEQIRNDLMRAPFKMDEASLDRLFLREPGGPKTDYSTMIPVSEPVSTELNERA